MLAEVPVPNTTNMVPVLELELELVVEEQVVVILEQEWVLVLEQEVGEGDSTSTTNKVFPEGVDKYLILRR